MLHGDLHDGKLIYLGTICHRSILFPTIQLFPKIKHINCFRQGLESSVEFIGWWSVILEQIVLEEFLLLVLGPVEIPDPVDDSQRPPFFAQ